MKRRLLAFTSIVFFLVTLLAGCSKESNGVPDSVVLYNTSINMGNYTNYQVIHNVDSAAHLDRLQLSVITDGPYGKLTQTEHLTFQYNKSTDLWTCIERSENITKTQELYWDKIINIPPLSGYFGEKYYEYNYDIQIKSIDFSQSRPTVSVDYTFESTQTSTVHADSVELSLYEWYDGTYGFYLVFEDCEDHSSYFADTYTITCDFQFNYQDGIKFDNCSIRYGLASNYGLIIHER